MKLIEQYSDIELFQFFKFGKMEAFEEIYTRHWPDLIQTANRRLESKAEAKDIVQDIFVSLFQKAKDIDIQVSLRAYLHQMLRYKMINKRRDNQIHTFCHKEIYRRATCTNDFSNELEVKELSTNLRLAISGLPKKCREVFLLSREENYSHKNISEELQISTSTVEKHIVKALKIIRRQLRYSDQLV